MMCLMEARRWACSISEMVVRRDICCDGGGAAAAAVESIGVARERPVFSLDCVVCA